MTKRCVALAMLAMLSGGSRADDAFSRADWLADFDEMQGLLSTNYPNLEWHAKRGVDLAGLASRARQSLAVATGVDDAHYAFERFLARLGDAHLSIEWDANPPDPADDPSLPDCVRFGFRDEPDARAVARHLDGYRTLAPDDATIAAGELAVNGAKIAVLRIASFIPSRAQCEAFLKAWKRPGREPPAGTLAPYEEAIGTGASRVYLAQIEQRLRELAAEKPAALLVDVAGNGGGKQLAITLARMLGGDDVPGARMQFVRETFRAIDLENRASRLKSALPRASRAEKEFLKPLIGALETASREVREPCDLSPLWRGEAVSCTNLVSGPFYSGGLVEHELPDAWLERPWAREVSYTAEYGAHPGVWTLPVIVLVDEASASATEQFAAMLQDAHRAVIVGSPTLGAGCGWTMGQYESSRILTRSRARLMLPDCTRTRPDGTNEMDGIQPDVLVGFRRFDSPLQRAARLAKVLPAVLERAVQ